MKPHFQRSLWISRSFGITLIELMIGLAISAVLFIALSLLYQLSKQTFIQLSNASDFNSNGFQMMDYLRLNIQNAGNGIIHPTPIAPQNPLVGNLLVACTTPCGSSPPGTTAVLQGWTYIGYYVDSGAPHVLPNEPLTSGATPATCASKAQATFPNSNYFGVQCQGQCFVSANGFDKTTLVADPTGTGGNPCSSDTVHNCGGCNRNDVYQRLIPHVNVTTNSTYPTKGDLLTITFAVRSGNNNATDCLGNPVTPPANPATTVPNLVSNSFRVSNNNTLQCQTSIQTNGVWNVTPASSSAVWTDIIPNVNYMRVMVGVNDNLGYTTTSFGYGLTANRYILPTGSSPPPLDVNRIVSIRLGLIVSSSNNVLTTPSLQAITVFPSTNITYPAQNDLLQRKLFTTTIFLTGYIPPVYPQQCVLGTTNYYIKMGGVPWVNGALSSDQCVANGTCFIYATFNSCEQVRYNVSNSNRGAAVPH